MSPDMYKIFHILGLLMVFAAVGGVTLDVASGGDGSRGRRLAGIAHGIGLVLMLVSGFGMLAKLGLALGGWVWVKVALWMVIAGWSVVVRKTPKLATLWWWLLPFLGAFAGYLAIYKPF